LNNLNNLNNLNKDNSVPNRLQPRLQPGIYMVHCLTNDWRYYGQTSSISARLSSHNSMLNRNIHPNQLLQADWNKYGSFNFQFVPLFQGEAWADIEKRREKETDLISLDRKLAYNILEGSSNPGKLNPFFERLHTEATKQRIVAKGEEAMIGVPKDALGKKIEIDHVKYPSIAEASRQTSHSRKLIRDRLNSPSWPDWKFLTE